MKRMLVVIAVIVIGIVLSVCFAGSKPMPAASKAAPNHPLACMNKSEAHKVLPSIPKPPDNPCPIVNTEITLGLYAQDETTVFTSVVDKHGKAVNADILQEGCEINFVASKTVTIYVNLQDLQLRKVNIGGSYTNDNTNIPITLLIQLNKKRFGHIKAVLDVPKGTVTLKGGKGKWTGK